MDLLASRSNPVRWKTHGVILLDLAFADHGSRICTSDLTGAVIVQDVKSREKVFELQGQDSIVYITVNDPRHLLALLGETSTRVYSLNTGELLWSWSLPYRYTDYDNIRPGQDISPKGDTLAVGSGETLYFFDARTGTLLRRLESFGPDKEKRWMVRYSPDGRYLAVARDNVYMLDLRSSRVVEYDTHSHQPYTICFSPDGDHLASGSVDGSITVWDRRSAKVVKTFVGHAGVITSIDYSSDGGRLLSASRDTQVRIWDAHSFECVMTMFEHQGEVFRACFAPNNQLVASCGEDRSVILRYADTSNQSGLRAK